jgi:hypothetical protein
VVGVTTYGTSQIEVFSKITKEDETPKVQHTQIREKGLPLRFYITGPAAARKWPMRVDHIYVPFPEKWYQ